MRADVLGLDPPLFRPHALNGSDRVRAGSTSVHDAAGPVLASMTGTVPEAEPLWMTADRWPLFAWVHRPAGSRDPHPREFPPGASSGGLAVLCPPLLGEHSAGYHLYRRLACALAADGVTAVRFDYEGTGDSSGPATGPGRVAAWVDGVAQAIRVARRSGVGPLALVGVRSGALIAAAAAARRCDVDALVLWDPWTGGRPFLRRQHALYAMNFPVSESPESPGNVEVPGFTVDAGTVADLSTLRLPERLSARRGLVLVRPGQKLRSMSLVGVDSAGGAALEIEPTEPGEQEALFDVAPLQRGIPEASMSRVVGWLKRTLDELVESEPAGGSPVTRATTQGSGSAPPDPALGATSGSACSEVAAVTATSCGDGMVYEQAVRLGTQSLFAMETRPRSVSSGSPVVIFLSSGADSHVGPSRLWVTLARRWAAEGARCLRVDLSGWGESEPWKGRQPFVLRAPEWFDDVQEVVAAAGGPREVVLVGLCSGAYQALDSALELSPLAVLAVNPLLRFTPPELGEGGVVSERRQICDPRRPWVARVPKPVRAVAAAARQTARDAARLMAPLSRSLTWLDRLEAAGVHVYCVCGEGELRQLPRSSTSSLKPPQTSGESGGAEIDLVPGLDHALLDVAQRDDIIGRLSEEILRIMAGIQQDVTARSRHSDLCRIEEQSLPDEKVVHADFTTRRDDA